MSTTLEEFRRYAAIIEPMLEAPAARAFDREDAMSVQVERGTILGAALRDPQKIDDGKTDRLIELSNSPRLADLRIVDAAGHHRPVYRPLLTYCWMQSFQRMYETLPRAQFGRWEESTRAWCDVLESNLGNFEWPAGAIPARLGAGAGAAAWTALTLSVAGNAFVRDAFTDLAADTFGHFAKRQRETGALLEAGAADNIETLGYDELVILHACASYAVQTEDRSIASLVERATAYHARETQPDHSTNQPWALFAFIWNESTRPLADQLLHATTAHRDTADCDGVSLMLLADALYCLQLFTRS